MSDQVDAFMAQIERDRERRERHRVCCGNCCWFAAADGDPGGKCFRYPPVRFEDNWDFPAVAKNFVCGEFQHHRTGETVRGEPQRYGMLRARLAELEDQIDRMREARE